MLFLLFNVCTYCTLATFVFIVHTYKNFINTYNEKATRSLWTIMEYHSYMYVLQGTA